MLWYALLIDDNIICSSLQRQQKIQKERLMNDFSAALNNFQTIQRRAAEKQRETVARARAGSRLMVNATFPLLIRLSKEKWKNMNAVGQYVQIKL